MADPFARRAKKRSSPSTPPPVPTEKSSDSAGACVSITQEPAGYTQPDTPRCHKLSRVAVAGAGCASPDDAHEPGPPMSVVDWSVALEFVCVLSEVLHDEGMLSAVSATQPTADVLHVQCKAPSIITLHLLESLAVCARGADVDAHDVYLSSGVVTAGRQEATQLHILVCVRASAADHREQFLSMFDDVIGFTAADGDCTLSSKHMTSRSAYVFNRLVGEAKTVVATLPEVEDADLIRIPVNVKSCTVTGNSVSTGVEQTVTVSWPLTLAPGRDKQGHSWVLPLGDLRLFADACKPLLPPGSDTALLVADDVVLCVRIGPGARVVA